MFVPISVEMSKHSIRSGIVSRPERLLKPVQRLDPLLAAALGAELLLIERQPRVALGQLEDPPLVAPLGRPDLHRAAAALRTTPRPAPGRDPSSRCTISSGGTIIALA